MNQGQPQTGLRFRKMHGAGNDFVVIDRRAGGGVMTAALARAVGDRHRGVGFDQLAVMQADPSADVALDFWNADGSTAGACGNATRCVAQLMMAETGQDSVTIRTERGLLHAERRGKAIWVNMGPPQEAAAEVPLAPGTDPLHLPLTGDPAAVGMGNPHAIFFVPDADAVDLAGRGAAVENDPLFPSRTNVEFASLIAPDRLRLRVWERGAGATLACGSGACAVVVAAARRGLTGRHVVMEMDGGTLEAEWREDGVWLTGPVATVFDGWLSPAFIGAIG